MKDITEKMMLNVPIVLFTQWFVSQVSYSQEQVTENLIKEFSKLSTNS